MKMSLPLSPLWVSLLLAASLSFGLGCSDDVDGGQNAGEHCRDFEIWNPLRELCEPRGTQGDVGGHNGQTPVDAGYDAGYDTSITIPSCQGFDCVPVQCPPGDPRTSISGVVTIPSGELVLPDVSVYIPTRELDPIFDGASCERCENQLSGAPLVETRTNVRGEFRLVNVPVGQDIPLVVQIGKWRRQVVVPEVLPCVDNPITDHNQTRLPRHRGEGDMPRIAVTTGGWDAMECLLRKIGISASEMTHPDDDGRINFYAGRDGTNRFHDSLHGGVSFPTSMGWWNDVDNLLEYDIVLHSCEGESHPGDKPTEARDALYEFTQLGGRVFLSHWHNIWLQHGPADFQSVANWESSILSGTGTGYIDDSFAKGELLREWMYQTGTQPQGQMPIADRRGTIQSINTALAQRWIWLNHGGMERVQYFSFNSPVGAEEEDECGRVVFSDIHVAAGDTSSPNTPFPTGCTSQGLTPQEKVLVYMFFDLSNCIVPDGKK